MSAQAGLYIVQVELNFVIWQTRTKLSPVSVQVKRFICGPMQMEKGYIWPFGKKKDTFGPVEIEKGYIW